MDRAGASRPLHAARRLLGGATLVAPLLALALASGSAHAQPQAPSGASDPWDSAPDVVVPHGWDDDWDDDVPETERPDAGGATPTQPQLPQQPVPAPSPGGDGWTEPVEEEPAPVTSTYIAGKVARMRTDGRAAIPRGAPKRVRSLIAQYNRIVGKRYKWGGGHAKLVDTGYDCSGAVGYGLIKGGLLRTTMVSGQFARWGAAGAGRWLTIYAHSEHVYMEIAGLRLDTSPVGDRSGRSGVRWRPVIGQRRGFKVRHPVGL